MTEYLSLAKAVLIVLCAVLAWVFVVRYSRLEWESTREGAHLMRFTLVVALVLTVWGLFRVFPVWPDMREAVGVLLFAWVAYELATRLNLLETAQQEAERREVESADAAAALDSGPADDTLK